MPNQIRPSIGLNKGKEKGRIRLKQLESNSNPINSQGYHGCAIGKAKQAAKTEIEKVQVGESFILPSVCMFLHGEFH